MDGGTESHSTKESCGGPNDLIYLAMMTLLSVRHPVLHSCIRSITKTHKRGHTHTNTPRWVTSERTNEATENASAKTRVSKRF